MRSRVCRSSLGRESEPSSCLSSLLRGSHPTGLLAWATGTCLSCFGIEEGVTNGRSEASFSTPSAPHCASRLAVGERSVRGRGRGRERDVPEISGRFRPLTTNSTKQKVGKDDSDLGSKKALNPHMQYSVGEQRSQKYPSWGELACRWHLHSWISPLIHPITGLLIKIALGCGSDCGRCETESGFWLVRDVAGQWARLLWRAVIGACKARQ